MPDKIVNDIRKFVKENLISDNKKVHTFSFDEIGPDSNNDFMVRRYAEFICSIANRSYYYDNIEFLCGICYSTRNVFFIRNDIEMSHELVFSIPYFERSKYYDLILKINNLIGRFDLMAAFVNNAPIAFEITFVVQTDSSDVYEQCKKLTSECNVIKNKTFYDYFSECRNFKRYNFYSLPFEMDYDSFVNVMNYICFFAESDKLEEQGYAPVKKKKNVPKLFISYPHGSKDIVYKITDYLVEHNFDVWIDKNEILPGDSFFKAISDGFYEADFFLMFISKASINANYAKEEIQHIIDNKIKQNKSFFVIKLDDVHPNDIMQNLDNYMYYDFSKNDNLEDLAKSIKVKLDNYGTEKHQRKIT